MMIKLKCINENCAYCYEVSENELKEYGEYHKKCLLCGHQLEVANLDEIVKLDIEKRAEEYINLWFRELGIEYTLELVERHKDEAVGRIYVDILKRKGLMK